MDEFYGQRYELVNTENFDEMLKYIDIGFFQRQVAMALKPVQWLVRNEDGTYTLHFKTTLVEYGLHFTPGVEFDEKKPNGVVVRALIRIEGNKVYHRQVETCGRTLNHEYEFFPDKLTLTTTAPGLGHVVKRNYIAVK